MAVGNIPVFKSINKIVHKPRFTDLFKQFLRLTSARERVEYWSAHTISAMEKISEVFVDINL